MTASPPKVNGHVRPPALPVMGDWQPIGAATPEPEPEVVEEQPEFVAQAQAEAIRAKAWADAEEQRIKAEAEAEAIRIKAAEDARKQKLANDRAERKSTEEQAASEARIAEHNRRRDASERARQEEARQAEQQQASAEAEAVEIEQAANRWRGYARAFYLVCAIVALPVQVAAFYNPDALWLMAAPLMLEGGAWVVLKGAAAAVAAGRPHWHYRLIAWLLAFIAAGINLWHGLNAFDPATAIGTAFASVAGPGVWDLHEHGRIRQEEGRLSWRQRRAVEKAAKAEAEATADRKLREAERQAYIEKADRDAADSLDRTRAEEFPEVHRHAWRLAADLGKTAMTEAIWRQAKLDVEGAPPGESAEVLRMRNAAEMRVEAARQKRSVNGSTPQVASQVLGTRKTRVYNPPARRGKRTPGDSPKQALGARRQASIAAKNARQKDLS